MYVINTLIFFIYLDFQGFYLSQFLIFYLYFVCMMFYLMFISKPHMYL